MDSSENTRANKVYELLSRKKKPDSWWPGDSRFEIAVGAILTQSTNWTNVETAIRNLKDHDLLTPEKIGGVDFDELAQLIRSSLYFNQKARKLKVFSKFLLKKYSGSMDELKKEEVEKSRSELLGLWGIGPETADSILLYALDKPVFVVDAYTKRLFSRVGLVEPDISYDGLQDYFQRQLEKNVLLYKHYHGLIVDHSKMVCVKNKSRCNECVLTNLCMFS